jgi:20S proteasome subunit alpha 3
LKQEYKDDVKVEDAIGLVLRVMSKTMDSTTLGSEKCLFLCQSWYWYRLLTTLYAVEFATLTLDPVTKQPRAKIYRPSEVDALLVKHDMAKKEDKDVDMK